MARAIRQPPAAFQPPPPREPDRLSHPGAGYGGLKPETIRRLEILGEQYDSDNVTTRRIRHDAKPVAGTRLVREYRGVEHTVTVLADCYEWEGRPYRSLSAMDRSWNGLIFFGIKRQGAA